ncbi:MAG: alpha/beta hydrolase [Spirochaetia bacterium]|nr:alpha/beta hydrolase [Spirochaetia bacterium]
MQPPSFEWGRAGSRMGAALLRFRRSRIHARIVDSGMQYRRAEHDGVTFHWYEKRRGRPVLVLLHGFLDSSHTFRRLFDRLSEKFDLIVLDLPGFGRTKLPSIREMWHIESMSRATARFLADQLCVRGARLVSHSMGGLFGLHMQRWFQEQFHGDLFSEMHMVAPGVLHFDARERDAIREKLFPRSIEGVKYLLEHLYTQTLPDFPDWALAGILYEWTQLGYYFLAENVVEDESRVFFAEKELRHYRVPITLYWGDGDALTPADIGRRMVRAFPDCELVLVKHGGHALHLEQQEAFLRELLDRL